MQIYSSKFRFVHYNNHYRFLIPSKTTPFSSPKIPQFDFFSPKNHKTLKQDYSLRHHVVCPKSMDEGSFGVSGFDDWGVNEGTSDYMIFSSDGEDSDGEVLVTPINDIDMPTIRKQFVSAEDALTATAQKLAMLGRRRRKYRISYGFLTNVGLISFIAALLAFLDWCAWRIIRVPLENFYFLLPFVASASLVACAGYVAVPILKRFNIRHKFRRKWSANRHLHKGTPTIGGLFFIPVGIVVSKVMSISSPEVSGVVAVTLAFGAVGLLDDIVSLVNYHTLGLSNQTKLSFEVAVAVWFSFWLHTKSVSSPYGMNTLVPLPAPLGLVDLGKYYSLLTSFAFILMANGHNLIDDLDGLAGGTSALTFVGMSIAVLPICSDLSIFGASMAGACVGFLLHNRYKASVSMGSTGSLALGGALAAMASCTGMFFPLIIASGISVLEVLAVIIQIIYFKITDGVRGKQSRLFPIAPLHQHLELMGIRQPFIVAGAYLISAFLTVLAGYVGLISA